MAGVYKARGIVLHTVKYGESALIAYLFTDVGGRRTYMIPGAYSRRGKGNKAAMFQPMFLLEFEGYEQPKAEMHRMKEVRMWQPLSSLPFDVRKSTISLFMAELLYRLIKEVEANEPLFDFLSASIVQLDALQEGISNFHLWFLVRLSAYLGFYPGNEYREGDCFDIRSGLFCPEMPSHRTAMESAPTRLLGRLMEIEATELGSLRLGHTERTEFMEAMLAFVGYHFDAIYNVRSLNILREVFL